MFIKNYQQYNETLEYSVYFAPRGRERLYMLGSELSQRYLFPTDLLIGIIGSEGSGKSTLIQGIFPGLHLTNDDDGVNHIITPLYDFNPDNYLSGHTFHIDIRYELAFKQMYQIVESINHAVLHGRRVIVEHFDLIYDAMGYNAQVIFAIGEEVIVARPTVFGPYPHGLKRVVDKTIKYRLMAHSAEDITSYVLEKEYNYKRMVLHSDVKHGFVIKFLEKPDIKISELEEKVNSIIKSNVVIKPAGENRIKIGDVDIYCTGVRTHVKFSGDIKEFKLFNEYKYDPIRKEYLLIGMVGGNETVGFENIMEIRNPGN
jgi:hypothetical protein